MMAGDRNEAGVTQENRLARFKNLEIFELYVDAAEKVFLTIFDEKTTIIEKKESLEGYLGRLIEGMESDNRAIIDILSTVEFGNRFVSHSLKVTLIAIMLGKRLVLPERRLWNLAVAAFLHDIGKARSANTFLNSYFKDMSTDHDIHIHHPEVGAAIAEEYFGFSGEVGQMIVRHHEQPDGKGFPAGLDNVRLTLADKILFTSNFMDNLLLKSGYSGVENVRIVMKNILDKFPEKFDQQVVNAIVEIASRPVVSNRLYERVALSLPCTFKMWQNSHVHTGRLLDLSAGGALLRTKTQLEPEMLLRLSFVLPGVISFTDKDARVVRRDIDDKGFIHGLQFEGDDGMDRDRLAGYINKYAGKPDA